MKKTSTKLKDMLNEHYILGELPSSKLKKMKWNPVTGKTMNEEGEMEEPITEATKPIDIKFVKVWEKMVSFLQAKMEEYKKNPTIKKNNQLYGMANGAYNNMNTVKGIPAQWLKIDKMIGEGKSDQLAEMHKDSINEGFATWKMQFAPMKLSGVSLDPKKTYTVKARSTVEAIKKAAKQAGLSGDAWMATQTHKLIKVG